MKNLADLPCIYRYIKLHNILLIHKRLSLFFKKDTCAVLNITNTILYTYLFADLILYYFFPYLII